MCLKDFKERYNVFKTTSYFFKVLQKGLKKNSEAIKTHLE